MKKFFTALAFALVFCATSARAANFQVESPRVGPVAEEKGVGGAEASAPKKDEKKKPAPSDETNKARLIDSKKESAARPEGEKTAAGRAAEKDQNPASISTAAATVTPAENGNGAAASDAPAKPGTPSPVPVSTPAKTAPVEAKPVDDGKNSSPLAAPNASSNLPKPAAAPAPLPLTSIYRIGIGDVLDIRLLNAPDPRQSTLYTVLAGGALDYPLLRDPVTAAGMTAEELSAQLIAELRHRGVFDRPQLRVSVREYASHAVLVSGLAGDPGTKILRREAIPLYVVVAEAQPKPEAGRAIIISHATGKTTSVDLNDAAAMTALVQPGDVVNLTVRPPEFFYIGGEIASPGQKDFHVGMTLTQALLASGGVTRLAGEKVKVSRAGEDGRLVSTEHNLRQIEGGVVPDPTLKPGDRIEVSRRK
ncbi:MAG TPA: polysaccharide biosynthesis/export family protein [Pyrinomonadaceae bacterium]|nr:polysaccharide biosynthesis/export family protein [Pyrinomonadaceae bacterium]